MMISNMRMVGGRAVDWRLPQAKKTIGKEFVMNMRFTRIALGGVAIAALSATYAMAADAVGEEPPIPDPVMAEPAPLNTWTGPYAGVVVGYGWGNTDTAVGSIDTDGFNGGAFAGYNFQTGPLVLGAEADAGYNGADGAAPGLGIDRGFDGSLRARMGFTPSDNILVYGTAGGALGQFEVTDAAGSDNQTLLGWTAGVGVDAMLTENIFGRAEYRYTDYGTETFNTGSGAQAIDATENRFQLGVGLKF